MKAYTTLNGGAKKGFTIIELMIVVAIVSILAVIAIPVYQNYVIRSKVSEALVFVASAKTTVSERYYSTRRMPTSNTQAGLGPATDYDELDFVRSLLVTSTPRAGTIVVTLDLPGSTAHLKEFRLVPNTITGEIHWICEPNDDGDPVSVSQVPPRCRGS